MTDIPRRLTLLEKKLDELADDCDPMVVSQIEGYLAGIIVCPDLIMPSEWLPLIWDTENDGDGPVFQSAKQAEKLMGLVMEHYNATIADIDAGRYAPVFDVDTRNDKVMWELWIDGFETAMALRPRSWSVYLGSDDGATAAIAGLLSLADIANRKSRLKKVDIDRLQAKRPISSQAGSKSLTLLATSSLPSQCNPRLRQLRPLKSDVTTHALAAPARNTKNVAG